MLHKLSRLAPVALLSFLLVVIPSSAGANQYLDSYTARLSIDDHFNTEGVRLQSAAAIIRQDRAHFHRFGIRDSEDTYDSVFGNVGNREILERMLNNGNISEAARRTIVDGTPLIKVDIYENSVDVFIVD